LPRKAGSVSKVTEDLSLENLRQELEVEKGCSVSDLSVKIISTWICKTISLAYESSGQVILDKFQVKAHDVRALASSCALFNNASLNEKILSGHRETESESWGSAGI
jgi:hypothetical protein